MKRFIFIVLASALIYGCSNSNQSPSSAAIPTEDTTDQNQLVIENDLELASSMIPSWINEVTVVKMDKIKAHSGEYASKIDDENVYSYAFGEKFENINKKLPRRVIVNGWYYMPDKNEKAGIVMDISEDNETKIWEAFNFFNVNPTTNQWNEYTAYFSINQPIKPNYHLKIYGYSGKKEIYLDDFKITFEY
ncbi:MAG: hypothetical protein CVU14_09295 [Bacteroidetes bacterium HGW-Bacteroidetes-9]|jgi:hypothetical protein|nr:MAG: hypothetical protein CVU14_09295 [Bacteroidetes bacterium HGW-Bacteroidetes-9]